MRAPVLELPAKDRDEAREGAPTGADQLRQEVFAQPLLAGTDGGGLGGALVPERFPVGQEGRGVFFSGIGTGEGGTTGR